MDVEDRDQLSRMFTQLATLSTLVPIRRLHVTEDHGALLQMAGRVIDLIGVKRRINPYRDSE